MKFIGFVYYEGRLFAMTDQGAVYELDIHSPGGVQWRYIIAGPFPEVGRQ